MFGSSPFSHDPFHRLPIPPPFSYADYNVPQPHAHRVRSPPPPHRRHRHRVRSPSFYVDPDPSSEERCDTTDDPYYMDNGPASPFPEHRHRRSQWTPDIISELDMEPDFKRTSIKLTRKSAEKLERDTILILPPTLTRLRVHMRTLYSGTAETLHVTVAGDVHFSDVVRQLVPSTQLPAGTRGYVRMRGSWQEPGAVRVSDLVGQGRGVMNEWGEMDVKIELGGAEKEGRKRGVKAWEKETGRVWEIRG